MKILRLLILSNLINIINNNSNIVTFAISSPIDGAGVIDGWYFCSNENEFCNSIGKIRYGANGKYVYNLFPNGTYHLGSGSQCNNIHFGGDPYPGVAKHCYTNVNISKKENRAINVPSMVIIVPGFGLPHIETKRIILQSNINMFGKIPVSSLQSPQPFSMKQA
jgi:hypothetical protein